VGPTTAAPEAPLNFHVVVSEKFLNLVVAREENQPGEIRDRFLDTQVAGRQVTATRLGIDLVPSQKEGRLRMVLEGDTSSWTSGFAPHAIVVNSVGHQHFRATKEILFDGYELATRHAVLSVQAENQNVGAVTKFTGRPLGRLVERVVLSVAQSRQPAAQAFARQRVVKSVYPRFDGEIDAQLGKGNELLKETFQARLNAAGLMPKQVRVSSTDTHLQMAASIAVPQGMTDVPPAPFHLGAEQGVSIYLHDSLLQGIIELAKLEGQNTTNENLIRMLRQLGMTAESPLDGLDIVEIEFVDVNPLVIRVGEDETRIRLRAAFKPGGHHVFPHFEVTIPIRLVKQEDNWVLKTGPVEVRKLSGHTGEFAESAIKKMLKLSFPNISFPQQLPATFWPEGKTPPRITSIRSTQGWLVIGID